MVEQVDAGDEPVELAVLLDDRDMILGEDRQKIGNRRFRRYGMEAAYHRGTHLLREFLRAGCHGEQQVGFIDDADELAMLEHRQLRYLIELHATIDDQETIVGRDGDGTAIIVAPGDQILEIAFARPDRKSTRLNSSHMSISYAVFCLKKKKKTDDAGIMLLGCRRDTHLFFSEIIS